MRNDLNGMIKSFEEFIARSDLLEERNSKLLASLEFLPALKRTAEIMRKAHDAGGNRWMSIWQEDLKAVEDAISLLDSISEPAVAMNAEQRG
jgi:hypothetical protein